MTRVRHLLPWAVVMIGVAVATLGVLRVATAAVPPHDGAVPAASAPLEPAEPVPAEPAPTPAEPLRLRLPSQDVAAPVVPVEVAPDRALGVPDDPSVLGWWRDGAWPGSGEGTVVLDGHVDSAEHGPGALFRLAELEVGAPVALATTGGEQRYEVQAVRSYPKEDLPAEVFDRTGAPRLVLISCGGEFDDGSGRYTHNVVAYAVPVGTGS